MKTAITLLVLLLLPRVATAGDDVLRFGDYSLRMVAHWTETQDILEISRGDSMIFRIDRFLRLRIGGPLEDPGVFEPPGTDIDGDGTPDLAVYGWSGGAHCCFVTWVFTFEPEFALLAEIDGVNDEVRFRQMDDDPALEAEVVDWTFDYWPRSHGGSPSVKVALDWNDGRLEPSAILTASLQPDRGDLDDLARTLHDVQDWGDSLGPAGKIFQYAIELAYRGEAKLIPRFLTTAWGGGMQRLVQLSMEFGRRLEKDRYYGPIEKELERRQR